ncbi:DUF1801 domain-containing protein [Diaminobutyricibacter tongyongensis]|uniref:DUF1801 domain-containing protein n=1 Tax=Leifsonia tongyongensis TaxID=1268043 RepID=A0A6L9Y037_9MICO|nr:DUF1801 domain-containing protein [Diaminobutyricibacter tongyongensis]NEN06885.1 DUF1801 domain-containing protein [Diaminobutyricibacter tongyongensis]
MESAAVPQEVEAYFDALDSDRRAVVLPVFETVRAAMPDGYRLGMQWRMPGWVVPLERFPDTYNKQPLAYVSLAAQKNYNSLYLMAIYSDTEEDRRFRAAWADGGRKLDMGKSCLRFRTLSDVDLDVVAQTVAAFPVERFLAIYERIRG